MKSSAFISRNIKSLCGLSLLSCMPLIFSSLITALLLRHEGYFLELNTLHWLPYYLLSACTMALAITPSTFIALVSGYFLGWEGTLFMLAGYFLASAMGYKVGQLLDGGHLLSNLQQQPKVRQFLEGLRLREWPLMVIVRLSPILPFSVMNLLMPALKIRFSTFLLAGFIGMLPRTLFSIWLGIQAKGLMALLQSSDETPLSAIFLILLTILSVGGILWIIQTTSRQILPASHHH